MPNPTTPGEVPPETAASGKGEDFSCSSFSQMGPHKINFKIFRTCGLQPSKRCLSLWKISFSERHWLYAELIFFYPANHENPALGSLSTALYPLQTDLFGCQYFSHLHHHHLWRTPHCHLLNGTFSSQQFDFGALFSWGMGRRRRGGCFALGLVVCWKK